MKLLHMLLEKPWKQHRDSAAALSAHAERGPLSLAPEKVALGLFLGVVGVMFMLFFTAYYVRMELPDWRSMPEPILLWLNTLVLFLASVVLQWTRLQLDSGQIRRIRVGLLLGGLLSLAFILGQLSAWQSLHSGGYFLYSNPANAFFYVLTGIHALHLVGGLWVWTRASLRVWWGGNPDKIRLSVELCTTYWHFLLLVWLVLFALLSYT